MRVVLEVLLFPLSEHTTKVAVLTRLSCGSSESVALPLLSLPFFSLYLYLTFKILYITISTSPLNKSMWCCHKTRGVVLMEKIMSDGAENVTTNGIEHGVYLVDIHLQAYSMNRTKSSSCSTFAVPVNKEQHFLYCVWCRGRC